MRLIFLGGVATCNQSLALVMLVIFEKFHAKLERYQYDSWEVGANSTHNENEPTFRSADKSGQPDRAKRSRFSSFSRWSFADASFIANANLLLLLRPSF